MLKYNGQKYDITPGHTMLLRAPGEYVYHARKTEPWKLLYLTLRGPEAFRTWDEVLARVGPVLELGPEDDILWEAMRLCRRVITEDIKSLWDAAAEGFSFCMQLRQHLDRLWESMHDAMQRPEIQQVVQAVQDQPATPWSVGNLAELAGLSTFHFSREFRRITGQPPGRFVTLARLEHARKLLESTPLPIKTIAVECGFCDSNHFGKTFRKEFGLTPGEFRKHRSL